jgi:catechol 2,3-dioxygenase-like lactoylglutathione lyase family enzyme
MTTRLEHANLHTRNVDAIVAFLRNAFPDFRVRRDDVSEDGRRWVHVGNDDTYVAVYEADGELAEAFVPYSGKPGVNHLGYVVDDAEALRERLDSAGYEESTIANAHPFRKRVYFRDPEGNDWEFVEYTTDNPAKRNDYES